LGRIAILGLGSRSGPSTWFPIPGALPIEYNKVVAQNSSFLFVTYGSSDTLSTPHILIRDFKNQHSAGRRDNNLGRSTTTGSGDCERLRLRELREQSHHPPSTKNIIIEASLARSEDGESLGI